MEKTYKPLLIESIKAKVDLDKQRFIGFDGDYCKNGKKALGVSDAGTAQGQFCPVAVVGILLVKAGGPITKGSRVQSDANGCAILCTPSGDSNGFALDEATAEGDVIRVIY